MAAIAAPTNFVVRYNSSGQLVFTWTNSQTSNQYIRIQYQNETDGGAWTTISDTITPTLTTYTYNPSGLDAGDRYNFRIAALNAKEEYTITCGADVAGSTNQKYFTLQDSSGSVGVWIDTDDSGSTAPAGVSGADRTLEITGIVTGGSANANATAVASILNADSQFTASANGAVVTVVVEGYAALTDAADGDTGWTFNKIEDAGDDSSDLEVDHPIYTIPAATGEYAGVFIGDSSIPSSYTHSIFVTGVSPYLTAHACERGKRGTTNIRFIERIEENLDKWEWGPSIAAPTFPT